MSDDDARSRMLHATLATPTAWKDEQLRYLLSTYRDALDESFDAGCETMGAVNDIVTPYDLPYQAKDALKSYVPNLLDEETYGANELSDDHPIRFVNRAATFDRDSERTHEICWSVPQPGRGTNFWIPLRTNPDQRDLWLDLLDDESDVSAGELRLQNVGGVWTLDVTANIPHEEQPLPDEPTPVGFDIGESMLVTGCAHQYDVPTNPLLIDGSEPKRLRKEMFTVLKRMQGRDVAQWRLDERFEYYQNCLTDIIEQASHDAVEYALQFENPVTVLEDLAYIRESLDYGKFMNRRLHGWAFARLQSRIADKAADAGVPVRVVHPQYTSKTCHACQHVGYRSEQAEFRCSNVECWVSEYQADINAAVNIADRLDPWGESLPVKAVGDDSPWDESPCDGAVRQSHERATNDVASQMPAKAGGDDNVMSSRSSGAAGTEQMTVRRDVSKPSLDE
jgi:IS605 OrfB family transposase